MLFYFNTSKCKQAFEKLKLEKNVTDEDKHTIVNNYQINSCFNNLKSSDYTEYY